jgi:hypothetical protein
MANGYGYGWMCGGGMFNLQKQKNLEREGAYSKGLKLKRSKALKNTHKV